MIKVGMSKIDLEKALDSNIPIREERVEGNSTYDLTVEHFREFLKSDKMYVPYVAFIKEGRILGCWTGTVDDHDLKKGLTNIQICQLYGIYTGLYNQII
jgi:hypothetical protein